MIEVLLPITFYLLIIQTGVKLRFSGGRLNWTPAREKGSVMHALLIPAMLAGDALVAPSAAVCLVILTVAALLRGN
jgi:hypothetical protein